MEERKGFPVARPLRGPGDGLAPAAPPASVQDNRIHAVAADHGYDRAGSYWTGPGRGWLAELDLPPVSREIVTDCLASLDALAPVIERPRRRAAPAREGRPAGQGAQDAARRRPVHRAGHAR